MSDIPVVLSMRRENGSLWLKFSAEDGTSVEVHLPEDFTRDSTDFARSLLSDPAALAIIGAIAELMQEEEEERRWLSYWN